MPDLVVALIAETGLIDDLAIYGMLPPSAGGQGQSVAAVSAVDTPHKERLSSAVQRNIAVGLDAPRPDLLRPVEQGGLDDAQLRTVTFRLSVDQKPGVDRVLDHANDRGVGDVFALSAHDILLHEESADPKRSIALVHIFVEDQADDLRFILVNSQIKNWLVPFVLAPVVHPLVAKGNRASGIEPFLRHLP